MSVTTPELSIILSPKSKFVNVVLSSRAVERESAPLFPTWLQLKFKSVKVELFERALEREVTPVSEISLN